MSQAQATAPTAKTSATEITAPALSLEETLRVLDVARGMSRKRSEAEVALAQDEIRDMMRKRLMEAAEVTGAKVNEADIDVAIGQYFDRLYTYEDPPFSLNVLIANLYVRRHQIAIFCGAVAALVASGLLFFS